MNEFIAQALAHFQRFVSTAKPIHNMVLSVAQKSGETAKLLVANPEASAVQTIAGGLTAQGNVTAQGSITAQGNITAAATYSFNGSGSGLTSLNATNLASGTVPAARLPLASSAAFGAVKVDDVTIKIDTNGFLYSTATGGGGGLDTEIITETPAGTVDGVNRVFTLTHPPVNGSLELFQNGFLLAPITHYILDGRTITYTDTFQPNSGDTQRAVYEIPAPSYTQGSASLTETPVGTINGTNRIFTLSEAPYADTLQLFQNGILLLTPTHYTLNSATITYVVGFQPTVGETHRAAYRY